MVRHLWSRSPSPSLVLNLVVSSAMGTDGRRKKEKTKKATTKWVLLWPFLVLLLLHAIAIYLFTRGFLLTRTELSSFSHCSDVASSPCFNSSSSPSSSAASLPELQHRDRHQDRDQQPACWTRPAVERLVIIVLDALRFDFVAPSTFFQEPKPWMDKLPVLQKLAAEEDVSARIFKAIADPPTTSLQRLKGLTTGGLPTFIDVGNSFGAPAIIEDNLIHQLVTNGKKVVMMGDDTWLQLFPDHFEKSYPYPSFNVKDLDTVDNGVIEHLIPSLNTGDWDVLIAHFLGVDHAGHIFGVESTPMIQKLEQYNNILEEVVSVLKNQSGPGGFHENTLLLVMGDHGQTTNGDHGGGTSEEVETSLFALSPRKPPASISTILDESFCGPNLDGKNICIGTIEQLDFAVTISALLSVPFPFGSIGHVNPELYALTAGTWEELKGGATNYEHLLDLEKWKQNYANTLCINSWQVKRYIDVYSATSVIGLPPEHLQPVVQMYNQAQANWSDSIKDTCILDKTAKQVENNPMSTIQWQINAYSNFLKGVARLARSAWTEFDLILMGVGVSFMLVSLLVHLFAIRSVYLHSRYYCVSPCDVSIGFILAFFSVAMRAASFLSNSFILTEGFVACFILATTVIIRLVPSISRWNFSVNDFLFLLLIVIIRHGIAIGMSKQNVGSTILNLHPLNMFGIEEVDTLSIIASDVLPIALLSILVAIFYKCTSTLSSERSIKCVVIISTACSYILILLHWASENNPRFSMFVRDIGRTHAPRVVYAIGIGLLLFSALQKILNHKDGASNPTERLLISASVLLSAFGPTILILLGRQSPFAALIYITGAWCIIKSSKKAWTNSKRGNMEGLRMDPVSVTQWSLLAVCFFFYTGHWCTFDGLRYGAAFIGFDHFNIIRQGILLSLDTFGFSHILPILSLPFIIVLQSQTSAKNMADNTIFINLTQGFLIYGLITAVTTTFTILCVTIQRRHLMVWGLFAPKYVFDAVGLLLTDVSIFLASLYYHC